MRVVLLIQAVYFSLFALWPIVHIRSFEYVSGPKYDKWLVKTVSLLLLSVALTLFYAIAQDSLSAPIIFLGLASAFSMLAIDVIYTLKGTISRIYLADACAELFLFISLVMSIGH
jgi:hypothetical protein